MHPETGKPLPIEDAVSEIVRNGAFAFDPSIVEALQREAAYASEEAVTR